MSKEISRAYEPITLYPDGCLYRRGNYCMHDGDPSGRERGTHRCLPYVKEQSVSAYDVTIYYQGSDPQNGTVAENPAKAALSNDIAILQHRLCNGLKL